jgi:hypothetical protein
MDWLLALEYMRSLRSTGIKIGQPRICCIEEEDQNNDSVKGFPKGTGK